jgi:amino acid transporter
MSTTATQVPTHVTAAADRQPVWKHGVAAAVVASVVTTALAAVASAAGVSFGDSTGASIPIASFGQLTLVFSLIGVGIAAAMARRARRPRRTFTRTAVALTLLSYVPDLTFGFDVASAATLIALHTVAAVIVVPTLAGRLSGR